jgi:HEAT repeat protein
MASETVFLRRLRAFVARNPQLTDDVGLQGRRVLALKPRTPADLADIALGIAYDPALRAHAAWLMRCVGGRGTAKALLRVLDSREGAVAFEAAAGFASYASGRANNRAVTDTLLRMLRSKKASSLARGQAAESLGHRRDPRIVPALLRNLHDPSVEVRFWCIFGLWQQCDRRALPALRDIQKSDRAVLKGWWSIRKEATDAIEAIQRGSGG